jgi:hypothetical protein
MQEFHRRDPEILTVDKLPMKVDGPGSHRSPPFFLAITVMLNAERSEEHEDCDRYGD